MEERNKKVYVSGQEGGHQKRCKRTERKGSIKFQKFGCTYFMDASK